MGTVLQFSAGRKELPKQEVTTPVAQEEVSKAEIAHFRKILLADAFYYRENRETVNKARACGDVMTKYLFDEANGFALKSETLVLRRRTLQGVSLLNLCEYLINSGTSEWLKHPHYYGAIFVEYDLRVATVEILLRPSEEQMPI